MRAYPSKVNNILIINLFILNIKTLSTKNKNIIQTLFLKPISKQPLSQTHTKKYLHEYIDEIKIKKKKILTIFGYRSLGISYPSPANIVNMANLSECGHIM